MHEHERRLIDAAIHFVDTAPNADGFPKAYETLVAERGMYQVVAEARLGDPLKNDAGAFGANSRPTSIRAAFTIPDRGSLRGKMLRLFAETDGRVAPWRDQDGRVAGWTDFEFARHFERDPRTVGSCRRDLVITGWVEEEGSVRLNATRPCMVWVLTPLGRQKCEELYRDG
jgi:hypothetical protein